MVRAPWLTRSLRALRSAIMPNGDEGARRPDSMVTRWSMIEQLGARSADTAWEWFLTRYQSFVRGILTGMLRSTEKGEQAAAEFWAYFFQHGIHEKADRNRRFRGYLAGVIRRYALDWGRKDRVAQTAHEEDEVPEPVAVTPLLEDEELCIYARAVLHNALMRFELGTDLDGKKILPDRSNALDARLLRLTYGVPDSPGAPPIPAMRLREAGKTLGIDNRDNALATRAYRARPRLRQLVEEEVRETVPPGGDLEDEIRTIFAAIQSVAGSILG